MVYSCARNCQSEHALKVGTKRATSLQLLNFIPFRLNRLAAEVSDHLAEIYRQRFDLEIPEWRILATLGPVGACTAQDIVHETHTHKTRISRAITQLEQRGLIERVASNTDGRELQLKLTKAGQRLYAQLVPLALERERALLACMTKTQLRGFVTALDSLEDFLKLTRVTTK